MSTHGSVAKSVRLAKEARPDQFCPVRGCLWRTGGGLCPKHESKEEVAVQEVQEEVQEVQDPQPVLQPILMRGANGDWEELVSPEYDEGRRSYDDPGFASTSARHLFEKTGETVADMRAEIYGRRLAQLRRTYVESNKPGTSNDAA